MRYGQKQNPDTPIIAKMRGVLPSLGLWLCTSRVEPLTSRWHHCSRLLSCFEQTHPVFTGGLHAWHSVWDMARLCVGLLFVFAVEGVGKAGERQLYVLLWVKLGACSSSFGSLPKDQGMRVVLEHPLCGDGAEMLPS